MLSSILSVWTCPTFNYIVEHKLEGPGSTLFVVFSVMYTIWERPTLDVYRYQIPMSFNCRNDVVRQHQ